MLNDPSVLVPTLNSLLSALHLPLTLESPLDLTPSILLAILESILRTRLPVPLNERSTPSQKVDAMKIFLGVLETDVIRTDVGLGDIDPRRLARGEWHEVVFVGELLCWLGKKCGVLPASSTSVLGSPPRAGAGSPAETFSTATNSLNSKLSMHSADTRSSETSLATASRSNSSGSAHTELQVETPRPRCIHEIEEPSAGGYTASPYADGSIVSATSYCDCSTTDPLTIPLHKPVPIRSTGWLHHVDTGLELASFAHSRGHASKTFSSETTASSAILTRHISPMRHRQALLDERARLLEELAKLKNVS